MAAGCASPWWNSFLDPTELGGFRENSVHEIQRTISFRDKPRGIPGATEPVPEDLVATVENYRIGPSDMISIRMLDFLARDVESEFAPTVDELGYIHIPHLGWIHVEGMTAQDLQQELVQQGKAAGIWREDSEPIVVVTLLTQQQRLYYVEGAVAQPGPFRILRPDFRLREAILLAGGLGETVKTIYVFRDGQPRQRVRDDAVYPRPPMPPPELDLPAPPVAPTALMEVAEGPNPPGSEEPPPEPGTREVPLERELEDELIDAITLEEPRERARPDEPEAPATTEPALPPFVFINDDWVESPTTVPVEPLEPEAPLPALPPDEDAVDWEELAAEGTQRVIRIPADRLRQGDTNFNIVVRHQDFIRIDPGPVGFFYLGGHVVRPGTYALQGEEITLTQALVSAGELDPLAWPTRCEIRRRIDGDREEITQWNLERIVNGLDPDLFIKPNDVIRVGTHAMAPFLATIRNSFRLTYGFGFVYDRNFADIDAYFPNPNPRAVRRQAQFQRFPGLFN